MKIRDQTIEQLIWCLRQKPCYYGSDIDNANWKDKASREKTWAAINKGIRLPGESPLPECRYAFHDLKSALHLAGLEFDGSKIIKSRET